MAAKAPTMAFTPDFGLATRPADSVADAEPSETPSLRRARVGETFEEPPTPENLTPNISLAALGVLDSSPAPPARGSSDDADAPTPRRGGERRTRRGGGSQAEMHLHTRVVEALRAESPALEDGGCWTGSLAWRPPRRDGEAPWVGGCGDAAGARSGEPRSGATRDDGNSVSPLNLDSGASPPPGRDASAAPAASPDGVPDRQSFYDYVTRALIAPGEAASREAALPPGSPSELRRADRRARTPGLLSEPPSPPGAPRAAPAAARPASAASDEDDEEGEAALAPAAAAPPPKVPPIAWRVGLKVDAWDVKCGGAWLEVRGSLSLLSQTSFSRRNAFPL